MSAAPTWPDATRTTLARVKPGDRLLVVHRPHLGLVTVIRSERAALRRAAFETTVTETVRVTAPVPYGYGRVYTGNIDVHTEAGPLVRDLPPNTGVLILPTPTEETP